MKGNRLERWTDDERAMVDAVVTQAREFMRQGKELRPVVTLINTRRRDIAGCDLGGDDGPRAARVLSLQMEADLAVVVAESYVTSVSVDAVGEVGVKNVRRDAVVFLAETPYGTWQGHCFCEPHQPGVPRVMHEPIFNYMEPVAGQMSGFLPFYQTPKGTKQ